MTDGRLIVTTGKSRSGKTLITRVECARSPRLLVWDPKAKWAQLDRCQKVTTRDELARLLRTNQAGRFAFVSPWAKDFDFWGFAAFAWAKQGHELGQMTDAVAEETANVTSPGKAPAGFHRLVSQGLEFGLNLHAITQRPSESDKTCVGNASMIRTFMMAREADRKYIAAELDVKAADVGALRPLEYIERDIDHNRTERKILKPPPNFPR